MKEEVCNSMVRIVRKCKTDFIHCNETNEIRNEEMKKKNNKIQMKTNNNAIVEDKHSQFAGDLIGW